MEDSILEIIRERLDHMDRDELEQLNRVLDMLESCQSDPAPSAGQGSEDS